MIAAEIFLDSSVVVAIYLEEAGSDHAQRLLQRRERPVISAFVELEVVAAVSLRNRIDDLTRDEAVGVIEVFDLHLAAGVFTRIPMQPEHFRWARSAIARFDLPLKAPDALHLAAAQRDGLTLVTADRQLARNAEVLGVSVDLIAS